MDNGEDDVMVLTTRSRDCVVIRLWFLIGINSVGVILTVAIRQSGRPIDMETVTMQGVLDILLLALSLFLAWMTSWGEWAIDRHGIEFRPEFGRYRSLRWADVERVRLDGARLLLRGKGVRITVAWEWLPHDQVKQGRKRIEESLSDKFDMSVCSALRWPSDPPGLVPRVARLVAIAFGSTAIWLGVGYWIVNRAPLPWSWRSNAFCIWSIFLLVAPFCLVTSKHERDQKRVYPEWPWRCRRPG